MLKGKPSGLEPDNHGRAVVHFRVAPRRSRPLFLVLQGPVSTSTPPAEAQSRDGKLVSPTSSLISHLVRLQYVLDNDTRGCNYPPSRLLATDRSAMAVGHPKVSVRHHQNTRDLKSVLGGDEYNNPKTSSLFRIKLLPCPPLRYATSKRIALLPTWKLSVTVIREEEAADASSGFLSIDV